MAETATAFLNPDRVVSYLDIPHGGVVADFGSGAGYYTLPLARRVGAEGKVYAFDIRQEMVDLVRSKVRLSHLLQVEGVRADLEKDRGTRLKDAVVDLVLISSALHQAEDKLAMLREAARILKPGRAMSLIEWDQAKSLGGPPTELRVPKAKARELAEAAGFLLDREFEAGSSHYGLLFKKR